MTLAKLLVAGNSIVNGGEEISYRANKHVYLPRFGAARNPFQAPVRMEAGASRPAVVIMPASRMPVLSPLQTPGETFVRASAPVAAKTQKIPFCPPRPAHTASWLDKWNPVAIWRHRQTKAKNTQPPVQSELSLNGVKVVHNDLSDADVEVVPMKSHAPVGMVVPDLPPPSRPWDYLAERMFRATTVD
jgi:hypothetical protein